MPSEDENVKYLYLVLTSDGPPTIDWAKVCEELDLNKGAATKRWSRLKKAIETNANVGPSAQQLLWLCLKYSPRDKAPDWNAIAEKCNTTAGAASKRYSRLKQAFDSGAAAPLPTPVEGKDSATGGKNGKPAAPAKRKRASKTKTAGNEYDDGINKEQDSDKEKEKEKASLEPKPKRARNTKNNQVKAEVKQEDSSDVEVLGERQGSQEPILPSRALLAELEVAVHDAQAEMKARDGGRQGEGQNDEKFYDVEEITQEAKDKAIADWLETFGNGYEENEVQTVL